jgi:hypothetical protein
VSGKWLDRAAVALLAVLWCCTVYRAATQSISIDEAYTYDRYVSKHFADMMTADYDANNHVLYTILAHYAVRWFGVSELSMRIPALLGGLVFFSALFLLTRLLFPVAWIRLLVLCLVSLNPFVLDFLCVGRGYGLANGLFLLALYATLRRWPMPVGGVLLGLAVAANLTFIFPGIALIAVQSLLLLRETGWKQVGRWALLFVLPATAVAALFVAVPLSYGDPSSFYFGADKPAAALKSFLEMSLYRDHSPLRDFGRSFSSVMTPVIVVLVVVLMRWAFSNLVCGIFLTSLFGIFLAHSLFGVLYPYRRTGLYLVILFVLSCGVALQALDGARLRWFARGFAMIIAVPVMVLFLAQINMRMYGEWTFDQNFVELVDHLVADHKTAVPKAKVTVGLNPLYVFQLGFYRASRGLGWIETFDLRGPERKYDYYFLRPEDRHLIQERNLRLIYTEPDSYGQLAAQ